MMRGPMRSMSIGGIAFGVLLLVAGIFVFLWSQNLLPFALYIWAGCGLGFMAPGIVVVVGGLLGRRMMRGGWRHLAGGWDEGGRRETPAPSGLHARRVLLS